MKKPTIEPGTISHGTLRTQDLVRAFLAELRRVHPSGYDQLMMPGCGFSAFPDYADDDDSHEWWQSESADWLLESITDELAACAPRGLYFGTLEGDGSDFGWWPETDTNEEPPTFTGNDD
jgi:hypothetical protein